ncbi:MAG: hypothetical protein IPJ88_12200 [Myxococcales bacterium]|nr:MAG: hypothetical protein IPJ88_12200 [Myxococcales bacterium]
MIPGCIPVFGAALGGDGSGQGYGACPLGLQAECDGVQSATTEGVLICDQRTHQCVSADTENIQYAANTQYHIGLAEALHPVADEQLSVAPQHNFLADIETINAGRATGENQWKTRAALSYKRLLSERFAMPLLKKEQEAITKLEQDIGYAGLTNSRGYFQNLAHSMAEQYQRLMEHDAFIEPLARTIEKEAQTAAKLDECPAVFQSESGKIDLSNALLQRCTELYTALIPKLRDINAKRQKIDMAILDNLYETAWWLRELSSSLSDEIQIDQTIGGEYAHARELAASMLSVYHTLVDDELEAQAMYSHLRIQLGLEVPVASFGGMETQEVVLPLGRWAQIATGQGEYLDQSVDARLGWFTSALVQALDVLKINNAQAQSIVAPGSIVMSEAWEYALVMEQSGLMSLYGGYNEVGAPKGYQAIHDILLTEAKAQEFAKPGLAIASAVACVGVTLALGPTSLPAVGVCLIATGIGIYQYFKLAHLSEVAQTFAYVGLEYSLVPPKEAVRLQKSSRITGLATVVDVIFATADVAHSIPGLLRFAQRIGVVDESITLERIQEAIQARFQSFFDFYRAETVYAMGFEGVRERFISLGADASDIDKLVERLLSLREHGLSQLELSGIDLEDAQRILSGLHDYSNNDPAEVKAVLEILASHMRFVDVDEYVFHLSEAMSAFASSVREDDVIVFLKEIKTNTQGSVVTRGEAKSSDFVVDLFRDWFGDGNRNLSYAFDTSRPNVYFTGQLGSDATLGPEAILDLLDELQPEQRLRFVYMDDWSLGGQQAAKNFEAALYSIFDGTLHDSRVEFDLVFGLRQDDSLKFAETSTEILSRLNVYEGQSPLHIVDSLENLLSPPELELVSKVLQIPIYDDAMGIGQMMLTRIPYHMGDIINHPSVWRNIENPTAVYFGVFPPSPMNQWEKTLIMKLFNVPILDKPY